MTCKSCPIIAGKQGITATVGARSVNECKARCAPGKYFDEAVGLCRSCGHGRYQPNEGSFGCFSCAVGETTRSSEATALSDCRPQCRPGHQLSSIGVCEPCPAGFYRSNQSPACEQCPSDTTTATIGSTSVSDCSLTICALGHFWNRTTDSCDACPKGSYMDRRAREESCESCPPDTSTEQTGAVSKEQCANPCLVDGRVQLCPANAYCVLRRQSLSYACECKPRYKKVLVLSNGAQTISSEEAALLTNGELVGAQEQCVHVCDSHCENGGRCEVQLDTNRPICTCPVHFYGERCEKRSDFVYIAGGIGAVVLLLVLLVLLVWMICVRTGTGRGIRSPLKKMSVQCVPGAGDTYSTMGGLGLGALAPGSLYYAPSAQLGVPATYAESIAPSHHSTYAHYYDDEEDAWEMPNFYNETYLKESLAKAVGASNGSNAFSNGIVNPAMNVHGASNPSLYGNKDDLYDRLRRHQYQGKKGTFSSFFLLLLTQN